MSSESNATSAQPMLDEDCRALVRRAIAAGVATIEELKTVVASLMADDSKFTPERLSQGLVGAGILTKWQASKLLAGKSKGFFLGTYKLLRPLGKGGMGMVYLGEHSVMKRQMALKILPTEALQDARRIERFKEEARASAQLDHPNIVRAYDFSESGGKLYIVMEYVDGIDLQQAVARDGVMSIPAVLDAMCQASAGLAHAHQRGIIHRDIKPSNLMLRTDGVVKVSDMGLARIGWGDDGGEGDKRRLTGTADFVAPEQALNSKTVDARADIYSLGCTMYYLMTARPPFRGQNVAQRLAKHQTATIPDVRQLRPDCPPPVAALITRMMAKRPADRPNSAAELLGQLQRLRAMVGKSSSNHQPLTAIAATSDTSIDDKLYQATLEDTSFSDSNQSLDGSESLLEFDFGGLASIPTAPATFGGSGSNPPLTAYRPPVARPPSGGATQGTVKGESQLVLLGVGLTVAVLALLVVVGVAVQTMNKPIEPTKTPIKVTEGEGGQITVITSQ